MDLRPEEFYMLTNGRVVTRGDIEKASIIFGINVLEENLVDIDITKCPGVIKQISDKDIDSIDNIDLILSLGLMSEAIIYKVITNTDPSVTSIFSKKISEVNKRYHMLVDSSQINNLLEEITLTKEEYNNLTIQELAIKCGIMTSKLIRFCFKHGIYVSAYTSLKTIYELDIIKVIKDEFNKTLIIK